MRKAGKKFGHILTGIPPPHLGFLTRQFDKVRNAFDLNGDVKGKPVVLFLAPFLTLFKTLCPFGQIARHGLRESEPPLLCSFPFPWHEPSSSACPLPRQPKYFFRILKDRVRKPVSPLDSHVSV